MTETALGGKLDLLNSKEDADYVKAVSDAKESVYHRMRTPYLWPDVIYSLTSRGKKELRAVDMMHEYALKVQEGECSESWNEISFSMAV